MPEVEVNIELYCSCGAGICNNATAGSDCRGQPMFTIEPCSVCLDAAEVQGHSEGYESAVEDARGEVEGLEREIGELEAKLSAALEEGRA